MEPPARHPVDDRQHRPPVAARDHRPPGPGAGRGLRARRGQGRPGRRRALRLAGADRGPGHQRRRRAARAGRRRLLLQPAVAEHRRAVSRCSRPASTCAPAPPGSPAASRPPRTAPGSSKACERGRSTIFGIGRPPGHDQPGRHGAQRRLRAGGLGGDHRVGGLLDVRVGRDPDRDGLLAAAGHPRAGRDRAPGERGVRRVGRDDGRRDGRRPWTG